MLTAAGVSEDIHASLLVTLDKLDKIGVEGVLAELAQKHPGAGDYGAIEETLRAAENGGLALDAQRIGELMSAPEGVAEDLVAWASDVDAVVGAGRVVFDPTLVRGMGYYTGSIIELEHPELGVSLGGGGRYDGMVGRFLGRDMPAFGFSLGFERLIDLIGISSDESMPRVALLYSTETEMGALVRLKKELVEQGLSVRLVAISRNMKAVFERLEADGFERVADASDGAMSASDLAWRELPSR
jgi:histidyl-tRNA synthetase